MLRYLQCRAPTKIIKALSSVALVTLIVACARQPAPTPADTVPDTTANGAVVTTAAAETSATPVELADQQATQTVATPAPTSMAPTQSEASPPSQATPIPTTPGDNTTVEAESNRDGVETIRQGAREPLPAQQQTQLSTGDGIDVDADGHAILRFEDLLSVEVLRDGELTLQQLDVAEQSAFVTVAQRGGALINNFSAEDLIDKRFTIQTEFATIEAIGTRFMVVKEANSPLEWVVGLDAGENDLTVTAAGVTKQVPTGLARWIAPAGEPSAGIDADMDSMTAWINSVQAGNAQPEVGEVVWPYADTIINGDNLPDLPPAGETFESNGVRFTLAPRGSYSREDCNGDGLDDIAIQNGTLQFDYRTVLARVRAVDVTVLNRDQAGSGTFTTFDPARAAIGSASLSVGAGQCEVLSARADQPYHYSEFAATNACFLGLSLTPPNEDGTPGAPRAAATCEDEQVTDTPAYTARITGIAVSDDGRYIVEFETDDFQPQLPGRHVHFFFDTVPPEEAGVPGTGPWLIYGGPSPFTEYTVSDRPAGATQMCILVANDDHSVESNTGTCAPLP